MNASIVTCDPKILGGKPTIAGTRITVELILEKMGAGETIEDVLEAHLQLTPDSIRAALAFAAKTMRADVVYPTESVDA